MPNHPPLQPVSSESGHTIGYVAATDAPMAALLEGIIQAAAKVERLQHQRRDAIRRGIIPPCPWDATDRWSISDRH